MNNSYILLCLAIASVAVALPQRPTRRFFPRRGSQNIQPDPVTIDETPEVEVDNAAPRFSSRNSFAPSSNNVATSPSIVRQPALTPVTPPAPVSAPRSRSRGSTTFIENLKRTQPEIDPAKLEELALAVQGTRRPSSRPSAPVGVIPSRPITRTSSRTPSRPSPSRTSSRTQVQVTERAEVVAEPVTLAPVRKSPNTDNTSRRQRLLQLRNKRPKPFQNRKTESTDDVVAEMTLTAESGSDPMMKSKLDIDEMKTLEASLSKNDKMAKEMSFKETDQTLTLEPTFEESLDLFDEILSTTTTEMVTTTPSTTTTTTTEAATTTTEPAVTTRRRVSALTRLRNSRIRSSKPVASSPPSGTRQRGTPPPAAAAATPAPVAPRLSSRRGGRGNSRGGAALAASTSRLSRPRSRARGSLVTETTDEEPAAPQRLETSRRRG